MRRIRIERGRGNRGKHDGDNDDDDDNNDDNDVYDVDEDNNVDYTLVPFHLIIFSLHTCLFRVCSSFSVS